jgi:hypothetical protein
MEPSSNTQSPELPPPGRIGEILQRAAELYHRSLVEGSSGRALLRELGLGDEALIERHLIGYGDGSLLRTLPSRGRVREELQAVGLITSPDNGVAPCERLAGFLTFPVRDIDGRTVSIYAESARPEDRTATLPDLPHPPWNSPTAKRYADVVVTDSILDALALERAGIHNVAAAPAPVPAAELTHLEDLGARCILLGSEATATPASRPCIHLPGRLRPLDFLSRHGADALSRAVREALERSRTGPQQPGGDLVLSCGRRTYTIYGLSKGPGHLRVTLRAEQHGRLHVDTLNLYRASLRRRLCADLTRLFDEPPEVIEADIAKLVRACEEHEPQRGQAAEAPAAMSAEERAAAEDFGRSPELLERICADYGRCGLVGEEHNRLLCYLAAVSRRLENPLSILILSSSGAGKSALQSVTLGFCPPEDVMRLTSLTGKALFYQDPTSLRHRVLALAETAGGEEAVYAIRSLISEGELVVSTTVRDRGSGRPTTVENRVEGPTAVFCTTTDPQIDPETRSRFFVIGVDESEEQTARVLAWQRRRGSAPDGLRAEEVEAIRRLHWNLQRLLRPVRVANPYAPHLTYGTGRLQSRREQPRYLALIDAVAFLRQMSRTVRTATVNGAEVDYIEVELDDIDVANRLLAAVLGHSPDELSLPAESLLALLDDLVRARLAAAGLPADDPRTVSFTRREVREFSGWNNTRRHNHLSELLELQYVALDPGGCADGHRYRLCRGPVSAPTAMESLGLKPVEALRQELQPALRSAAFSSIQAAFTTGGAAVSDVTAGATGTGFRDSGISGGDGRCAKTPTS